MEESKTDINMEGRENQVYDVSAKAQKDRMRAVYWELVRWELRKLWEMPVFWVFLLLCIVFNVLLAAGSQYGTDYISYVKEVRKTAGSRMGKEFDEKVSRMADCAQKELLIQETAGARDVFETYSPKETAEMYISRYRMTGWAADALYRKYAQQEARVRMLDKEDASMDAGAAGMTKPLMELLFGKLCRAVLTEGILLAVFAALYICGMERTERTWLTVYATKKGRGVQREKFLAGLFYTAAAYAVTAAVSVFVFAYVWQLGDIWNTDMSTQFHDMNSMGVKIPFVSWAPFTMRSYLAAVLTLGMAAPVLFYLSAYLTALLVPDSYAGFLLLAGVCALNFEAVLLAGNSAHWGMFEAAMWTPVMFWWMQPVWFTDMGISAVVPWQECRVFVLCLAVLASLLYPGFRYFYGKDFK